MKWYYVINERRFGPVSEKELDELRGAGAIGDDTLVWRSGFADWRPLSSALFTLQDAAANEKVCAECGNSFPQSEMLFLNRTWVCAQCKPLFIQRLAEGPAPPLGTGQIYRDGDLVVFRSATRFPDRCIKCNAPAKGYRLDCQLYWAPAFRIVMSHTRAEVSVGLCEEHRARRRRTMIAAGSVLLIGALMLVVGANWNGFWAAPGVFMLLGSLSVAGRLSSLVSANKIADGVIWMRGTGEAFRASLPDWTESDE